ncbi:hypothetical protein HD600_001944 [Microbacterium ginsengiterrae]|uniref:DUF4190 domain-containing protein n=1 Tax=Microbacterium ginsengiterrae TaxID=546115 RepID=A0A7W9CDT2_9MICO|nr:MULTISPECIES: hypothetical protein [Microbacterium]MBB5743447.1 hypothetical protein [Microbacterium ginsengiterrae]
MTDPSQRRRRRDGSQPRVEAPSPDVEHPADSAQVPGARQAGYTRMPTGPLDVMPLVASGPADTAGSPAVQWAPADESVDDSGRLAPWALVAAIVALIASWFVGWGIPLAIIAVVAAIMSLRRPVESRSIATWALVLGLAATVFSLGWLIWAAMQFEQMG